MSDVPTIIPGTGNSKRSTKLAILFLSIAAFVGLVYYYFFPHLDMKAVKVSISEFAKDSDAPVQLEYILLQGVHEIRWGISSYRAVKKVAEDDGITLETAIVDAAINQARAYGYID